MTYCLKLINVNIQITGERVTLHIHVLFQLLSALFGGRSIIDFYVSSVMSASALLFSLAC